MSKNIKFGVAVLLFTILTSCSNIFHKKEKDSLDAFKTALEANLKFRQFDYKCAPIIVGAKKICKIVIIPLKKEIIDAAIQYRCSIEKCTDSQKDSIKNIDYKEFLEGNKAAFIFIVNINNQEKKGRIFFKDFSKNVKLKTESNQIYSLVDFTRNFEGNLNPGWNDGFLYFNNFRKTKLNTYSVHFDNLMFNCVNKYDDKSEIIKMPSWSFSFDESETKYLSLIQEGLSYKDLRRKYVVTTYEEAGLNEKDIINIIKLILKFVK